MSINIASHEYELFKGYNIITQWWMWEENESNWENFPHPKTLTALCSESLSPLKTRQDCLIKDVCAFWLVKTDDCLKCYKWVIGMLVMEILTADEARFVSRLLPGDSKAWSGRSVSFIAPLVLMVRVVSSPGTSGRQLSTSPTSTDKKRLTKSTNVKQYEY